MELHRCKKCRWNNQGLEKDECTNDYSPFKGVLDFEDETIYLEKCTDISPLAEFEDEFLSNSLNDTDSEVMGFE